MLVRPSKKYWKIFSLMMILLITGVFLFSIGISFADNGAVAGLDQVGTASGLGNQDLKVTIGKIIKIFLGFIGVIGLVIVLYAGFLYMTAGGDAEKVTTAKKWLINGLIGLVIIFSAYAITSFVLTKLSEATDGGGTGEYTPGGYIPSPPGISFIVKTVSPQGNVPIRNVKVKMIFSKAVNPDSVTADNITITKQGEKGVLNENLEPYEVQEDNGNGETILSDIIKDDNIWNNTWVVCSNEYLGATPMKVFFDITEIGSAEPLAAKLIFESANSGSNAKMTIKCGDEINGDVSTAIKTDWLPPPGINEVDVPATCYENADNGEFYISWYRTGGNCLKFDYINLNVEYEGFVESEEIAVEGNLEVDAVNKQKVTFTPSVACPEPNQDLFCFDKNTAYKVTLKSGGVKTLAGDLGLSCSLGSLCSTSFTSGELIDTKSPEVYFTAPTTSVSQNADVEVNTNATDDGGVSNVSLFVDGAYYDIDTPPDGQSPLEYSSFFIWDTDGVEIGKHSLKAEVEDINDHKGEKTIQVSVLPEYCFDQDGLPVCSKDHPDCGKCDGEVCSSDDECAGICVKNCDNEEANACETDSDCDGAACLGFCATEPVIADVAPKTGGPGNMVSIVGAGFLNYDPDSSKVYFTGPGGAYIPAELGCQASSAWNNYQIIAKVPAQAITGPIKVVNYLNNEDTTDDDDGWVGDFIVDSNINYPGLCSVTLQGCQPTPEVHCDKGAVNNLVRVGGNNFGQKDDDDAAFLGGINFLQGAGFAWSPETILSLQIPLLEKGKKNTVIDKGPQCLDKTTKAVCEQTPENIADCLCKNLYSNPVRFEIVPSENLPKIDMVEPAPAPIGQLITISGQYFGNDTGHVEIHRLIGGDNYDWITAIGCGPESWSDSEVVIKIPETILNTFASPALSDESAYSDEYKIVLYTSQGLVTDPYDYEIVEGPPGPGLCLLDPNNGPEGIGVDFKGEYFGNEGEVYFSKTGGPKINCPDGVAPCDIDEDETCQCAKVPDPGIATSFGDWSAILIENAVVPEKALSGGVFVKSDQKQSNSVSFTVGSCSANSCAEGEECCSTGVCQTVGTCTVEVGYEPSEYMWMMSTGPLPTYPRVIERSCWPGQYTQSPSPFKNTTNACPNGLISATFNMIMKTDPEANSFQNNIIIKRCLNTQGGECNFDICNPNDCVSRTITNAHSNDFNLTNLNLSCYIDGQPGNETCDPEINKDNCFCIGDQVTAFSLDSSLLNEGNDLVPSIVQEGNHNLHENTWYQVTIKGGTGGVSAYSDFFEGYVNMLNDYTWKFKTKSENCVPDKLLMSPLVGLIKTIDGKQKYTVSGQYQCQEIGLSDKDWQWDMVKDIDKQKAEFAGYACFEPADGLICQAPKEFISSSGYFQLKSLSELGQGQTFETPPGKPMEIAAEAELTQDDPLKDTFDSLYKKGFLKVKFADPKIISYYPNCNFACINASIGANFNTFMDKDSFMPETVKLYSCYSSDCVVLTDFGLDQSKIDYQEVENPYYGTSIHELKISLHPNKMEPNTYYRMVVTNGVKSYSGVNLTGLNYSTGNAPGGDCGNRKDDDADGKADVSGGYSAVGAEDKNLDYLCGCYDQAAGIIVSFAEISKTPNCQDDENIQFACVNLKENNAVITDEAELETIQTENEYLAPDPQCAFVSSFEIGASGQYDAFSWIFKTKDDPEECKIDRVETAPVEYMSEQEKEKVEYWAAPYSAPDECSASGQLLDAFAYDWDWLSTKPVVASITNTLLGVETKPYCNDKCQAIGSTPFAAVCGNGEIEPGEECDDSNIENEDGCSEICLREPLANCADPKTQSNCCGNGEIEPGEECDQGCDYLDVNGQACVPVSGLQGCSCVAKGSACTAGCLNTGTAAGFVCGNGKKESGEDADFGGQNSEAGLNEKCLYKGSAYKLGEQLAAAVCGNGVLEVGEECEGESNCTNTCVWKGFPTCTSNCTKEIACSASEAGDPGCVGKKQVACNEGADCIGTVDIPCQEDEECETKTINCIVGVTNGCADGYKEETCFQDDPDCDGQKILDCNQCAGGQIEILCNKGTDADCCDKGTNPFCEKDGAKKISCAACQGEVGKQILSLSCAVSAQDCATGSKTEACLAGSPDCECSNCCGNGIPEDYNGDGKNDEECEATCKKLDGSEYVSCLFGEDDCACALPDYCSAKCLNLGSSYAYDNPSYCNNGTPEAGEDLICECSQAEINAGLCTIGLSNGQNGSPYQMATSVPSGLEVYLDSVYFNEDGTLKSGATQNNFFYDVATGYIIGDTEIQTSTKENPADEAQVGMGDFAFRTNDPDLINKYKDILPHIDDWSKKDDSIIDPIICEATAGLGFDDAASSPVNGSVDVCPNAMLYTSFNKKVYSDEAIIKLYLMSDGSCPTGLSQGAGSWYSKAKEFVRNLLVKVGFAATVECEVGMTMNESTNIVGNTNFSITPKQVLQVGKQYKLKFSNLKNNCDETYEPVNLELNFVAGDSICLLDNVIVEPQQVFVTKANQTNTFRATARSGEQKLTEMPGTYEWVWDWTASDMSIVDSVHTCKMDGSDCVDEPIQPLSNQKKDSDFVNVRNLAKNGSATIMANVVVTKDNISEASPLTGGALGTLGAQKYGTALLNVTLCDHLWEPAAYAPDKEGNNKWSKMQSEIKPGEYHTTYIYENNFNVGLFYCRDFGGPGFEDDLPKLEIGEVEFAGKAPKPRYGIYFDKSFDYVKVPDSGSGNLSFMNNENNPWTIETWLYSEEIPEDRYARIFYKNLSDSSTFEDGKTNNHVQMALRKWGLDCDDDCEWSYENGPNSNNCTCAEEKASIIYTIKTPTHGIVRATTDGVGLLSKGFNHIALKYDGAGGNTTLYVNGVDVTPADNENTVLHVWPRNQAEKDVTVDNDYQSLFIGGLGKTQVPLVSLAGYVDDFRIWNIAKDPQTEDLVNPLGEPNLVGYWKFDENINDVKGLASISKCTVDYIDSKCDPNENFYIINLTELAKEKGLIGGAENIWEELAQDTENQCNDGIDNDSDGLIDIGDHKCKSDTDPWEDPELFEQYFFVRDKSAGPTNDYSSDVISLRIYENPEALPPDIWYQRYAPNPAPTTAEVKIDCQQDRFGKYCYTGAKDGTTVYAAASNMAPVNADDVVNIYNNIYVLGYSQGSNAATQNIYSQLVNLLWFNTDIVTNNLSIVKPELIRDTQRISDMVLTRAYIELYKKTPPHNGAAPLLDAGTYVRGRSFSIWPSWQKELGKALGQTLPTDPLNHFAWEQATKENPGVECGGSGENTYSCPVGGSASDYQCVVPQEFCVNCPVGYDMQTCYNSANQKFSNFYDTNPNLHSVYSYLVDPLETGNTSAYDLQFSLEVPSLEEDASPMYSYKFVPGWGGGDSGWQPLPSQAEVGEVPQCKDGLDNDSDGLIDYPNDLGCATSDDNDEYDAESEAGCDKTLFVFFIDGSLSMDNNPGNDVTKYHRTILNTIVDAAHTVLDGDDYYLVQQSGAGFTGSAGWTSNSQVKLVDPVSNEPQFVKDQINTSSYVGAGNMAKWIDVEFQAANLIKGDYDRVTYILITDASDTGDEPLRNADIALAQEQNANIHLIYIRKDGSPPTVNQEAFFKKYADDTGGLFFLGDETTLSANLGDLVGAVATCKGPAIY